MGWEKPYPHQKILVKFKKTIAIKINRNKTKEVTEAAMNFFISTTGNLCYTFYSRTGYPVTYEMYTNADSFTIFPGASEEEKIEEANALIGRFHPNAWGNLRSPEKLYDYYPFKVVSIKSKFQSKVIEALKEAFDNKTSYSTVRYGKTRDLSVETRLCDDGIFRAWFSSEYSGCGNGDYYILINPTTALFLEKD